MKKINFQDLPSTDTPIKASTLTQMQSNIEESCVAVSSTQPETGEKVWIQQGKNLINPNRLMYNINYNETTNQFEHTDNWILTDYIPIELNEYYIFSHSLATNNGAIDLFDKNKNYLGQINLETIQSPFQITNANVKYIIIKIWSANTSNETWMQLEQGSAATEYEAYIEPKIWCKNNNGEFKEFYDESEMNKTNYSIAEQVIGTWIDGKPLYRKTIPFTTGTSYAQWQQFAHGIPNVGHIMVTSPTYLHDGGQNVSLPDLHTQFGANSNYIRYVIATEGSGYGNKPIWVTVEYTKTTD